MRSAVPRAQRPLVARPTSRIATPHPVMIHQLTLAGVDKAQPQRPVQGRQHRRAQDRHAEGGAHLPAGRRDARGDPRLGARHAGHRGVRDRGVHGAAADAEDHVARHEVTDRAVAGEPGQHDPARGGRDACHDQRQARPPRGHDAAGYRGEQHGHRANRQQVQSGVQRRVAPHVLQIQGVQEQEAAERGERAHRDHRGAGERRAAEEPQVERAARRAAARRRSGQIRAAAASPKQAEDPGRGPAGVGALDDRRR